MFSYKVVRCNIFYCYFDNFHKRLVNKVKVKSSLSLISTCHGDIWGSGGIALSVLNLSTTWNEWSFSWSTCFIPGERAHSDYIIVCWVGLEPV
jgi:hypothetical protein